VDDRPADLECDHCSYVGQPVLAWTPLGDGKERIGAWCRSCRRFVSVVDEDDLTLLHCPPWQWLQFDRLIPEAGAEWPIRREVRNYATEFSFGALAPIKETVSTT
jgi:hypothetical protein